MNIHRSFPRYSEYQSLFPQSRRLQTALCEFYSTVVRLCEKAVRVMRREGYFPTLPRCLRRRLITYRDRFYADCESSMETVWNRIWWTSKSAEGIKWVDKGWDRSCSTAGGRSRTTTPGSRKRISQETSRYCRFSSAKDNRKFRWIA